MMRRAALAATAMMVLSACGGQGASSPDAGDRFAGLDDEILSWRQAILAEREDCASASADQACRAFEVACKGEREISADETARGVRAKVVSAMTFESWDPARSEFRPGSTFAEFTRDAEGWTRSEAGPVNLTTCAAA